MKIKKDIVGKILTEVYKDVAPVIIETPSEQRNFIEELIKNINKAGRSHDLNASKSTSYSSNRSKEYINAAIYWHGDYSDNKMYIRFKDNTLMMADHVTEVAIDGSIPKILELYDKMEVEREKVKFEIDKKEKIKKLKINAIESVVIELAKKDKFEYYIDNNSIRVNLHIKISSITSLIILIPFSKFQEAIGKVSETIQTIRNLTEQGLQFKIKGAARVQWNQVF